MNALEQADRIAARAWDREPDSATLCGLGLCFLIWGCITFWLEVLDLVEEKLRP